MIYLNKKKSLDPNKMDGWNSISIKVMQICHMSLRVKSKKSNFVLRH